MKKLNATRILAFLLLIALSVGFGFAFDGIATAAEKHRYPQKKDLSPLVERCAAEFAVPESVLWSVMRTESGFQSNKVSKDGEIGLMQLSPERFRTIYETVFREDAPEEGLLYDPETNLRAGAAYLSYLYREFGVWKTVYAAYDAGVDAVTAWAGNPDYINGFGNLEVIPDPSTAAFVSAVEKSVGYYNRLYEKK